MPYPAKGVTVEEYAKKRMYAKRILDRNGCWLWDGYLSPGGYGIIYVKYERHMVHRLSYEIHVGSIPEGLDIDHLCRVRRCFNPEHLEPTTRQENLWRGNLIWKGGR